MAVLASVTFGGGGKLMLAVVTAAPSVTCGESVYMLAVRRGGGVTGLTVVVVVRETKREEDGVYLRKALLGGCEDAVEVEALGEAKEEVVVVTGVCVVNLFIEGL